MSKANRLDAGAGAHKNGKHLLEVHPILLCAMAVRLLCLPDCTYGCMPACSYACSHTFAQACAYVCAHACTHARLHAYAQACPYASSHACVYLCVFARSLSSFAFPLTPGGPHLKLVARARGHEAVRSPAGTCRPKFEIGYWSSWTRARGTEAKSPCYHLEAQVCNR